NYALGASYIALPWWCGQCFFNVDSFNPTCFFNVDSFNPTCFFNVDSFNSTGKTAAPMTTEVAVLTILYSWAGLGIAIVNDFKSIEGDREMGLMSLPVQFGIEKAKWICAGSIDVTQLSVAGYLAYI
ncbi:hypothetical protein T484DRAFT_1839274, partial [Baffinella frigidus]